MVGAFTQIQELLVYDGAERCPYLPGRTARMPLRLPMGRLSPQQLDERLAAGDRRTGAYLYRTECPQCQACEPIRLDVAAFAPGRTARRAQRRAVKLLEVELGPPLVDRERVELFNRHRRGRGLASRDRDIDTDGYCEFLVKTCCDTFEIRYRLAGRLAALAVCDRGANSLNAVYCYFDPELEALSPGVFSILTQLDFCRQWGLRHLYLGLYIAENEHMAYKARYRPHERLVQGDWRRFEKDSGKD